MQILFFIKYMYDFINYIAFGKDIRKSMHLIKFVRYIANQIIDLKDTRFFQK